MPDTSPPPVAPQGAPAPTEIIHVDEAVVACDGGGGPLGHPRVFLRIVGREAMCPYCSRLYVLNEGAGHDSGH
ncbi:MAG TPA: zinc-finger domain-containing protein [Acetobacteraceae bacterium]|nr:zinc-finger domain-containing protein [Acetobacteraceae bacterium]